MPFYFWDPTMILLIPAIILAIWAQMRVSSTYSKYSKVSSARGATGGKISTGTQWSSRCEN
jgi:Zn-dependent membrane protease YugP